MFFEYDGKKLTVSGRGLVVATSGGQTVISETTETTTAAPATTGAKRGRKPKSESVAPVASSALEFDPEKLA